jgi:hypothetical protein
VSAAIWGPQLEAAQEVAPFASQAVHCRSHDLLSLDYFCQRRLGKLPTTDEHSDFVWVLFVAGSALVLKQRVQLGRPHLHLEAPEDHETHPPLLVELAALLSYGQAFFGMRPFSA